MKVYVLVKHDSKQTKDNWYGLILDVYDSREEAEKEKEWREMPKPPENESYIIEEYEVKTFS